MTKNINLREIERKIHRDFQQDGIVPMYLGLFLAGWAGFCDYVISDFQSNFPVVPFILFFGFSSFIIEFIRRRITYPRIGYARMIVRVGPRRASIIPIIIFILSVISIIIFTLFPLIPAIAVSFFSDTWNIGPWLEWSPALFGAALAILLRHLFAVSGDARYHVLTALALASGIVLSLFPFSAAKTGVILHLLIMGGVLLLWGLVEFVRFLRKYPKLADEGADDHG